MNKILILKFFLIAIYLFIALFYFYDDHFPLYTGTLYSYGNIPFMVATISFGIIISATVYNTALYVYLKKLQYLYYALAQLSALFFLMNIDALFIAPFDTIFLFQSPMLLDFSQMLMLVFSLLFLRDFFRNYKIKNIDTIVKIIFYLIAIDFILLLFFSHAVIFKFIPQFIPILFVLTEAIQHVKKRDIAFNLIIIGWGIVLVTVISEYAGLLKILGFAFPFFHIAIALESIIISLAIAYKFKLLEEERQKQQALLLQQSRLASMGEMVSSIAHQWRQPLNAISFGLMNIKKRSKDEERNLVIIEKLNQQLQYMSSTIEVFRNFYNPSKVKNNFSVYKSCQTSYTIAQNTLEPKQIKLNIENIEDFMLFGKKNELEQVILSLINNAKDAFVEKKIEEPIIHIIIENPTITIVDNAGGIDKKHIKKIFIPYFSTKKNSDGIGLHISKLIIEKEMGGKLSVVSENSQTTFILDFQNI